MAHGIVIRYRKSYCILFHEPQIPVSCCTLANSVMHSIQHVDDHLSSSKGGKSIMTVESVKSLPNGLDHDDQRWAILHVPRLLGL
jgi:hypothetical protein